jgi:uncharacterized membrane protein
MIRCTNVMHGTERARRGGGQDPSERRNSNRAAAAEYSGASTYRRSGKTIRVPGTERYGKFRGANKARDSNMGTTSFGTPRQPPSLEEVIRRRRPLPDIHKQVLEKVTPLDRLALWITMRVGSMAFFLCILAWTACWLGWNLLAPPALQFDPPIAFVFWLFISNAIQLLLMPLIMVGQNLLSHHAEARAEHDLEVNVRAEQEIEVVLRHLEYQNTMLIAMVQKICIDPDAASREPVH